MLQVVDTTSSQDKLGQSSAEFQSPAISQNAPPTPGLFIARFVMRQCSALEFRSHAATFSGKRRLLVTTVHLGACTSRKDRCITTSRVLSVNAETGHLTQTHSPSLATRHPGLVDPPCHAQEAPHFFEGNRGVPAADGMETIQTQQA